MANIKVNAKELKYLSQMCKLSITTYEASLKTTNQTINAINTGWVGPELLEIINRIKGNEKVVEETMNDLYVLSRMLDAASNSMETTDQELANQIRSKFVE